MPLIVILGYAFVASFGGVQVIFGEYVGNAIQDFHEANLAGGAIIPFVAGLVGLLVGIASTGSANRNLSPTISDLFDQKPVEEFGHFLSTRPFTNSDFAKTYSWMTFRSLLFSWTIWLTMFVGCLFFADIMHRIPKVVFPGPIGAWYIPLVVLGSWITMANSAIIGLSGRPTVLTFLIVGGVFAFGAAEVLIKARCSEHTRQIVYHASVWILSASILLVTPLAFFKAVRSGLVKRKHLCFFAITGAGIAVSVFAMEHERLPILAYLAISAFSALMILPFATIPLAIAWNRHR
jgi:hypothetical protein